MLRKKMSKILLIAMLLASVAFQLTAQKSVQGKYRISGTLFERDSKGKTARLSSAFVSLSDYGIFGVSNASGEYALDKVPSGKIRLNVSYLGKVSIDTLLSVDRDTKLNFTLVEDNFRLVEIHVVAVGDKSGQSTASKISRSAMDHLQATSLNDVLSLLPGGLTTNQDLNNSSQINIRNISSSSTDQNLNALGSLIIRDGAPMSNNANMQAMSPSVAGAAAALGGNASPSGGVDIRGISVDNIESVEVIRGIPSVQYGDLTSGVVILNSKAGREPLRVKAKTNPNVYQFSASTGYLLSKGKGALNVSGDYAYNVNDPVQSYLHYERATAKVLYSNAFLKGKKLRTNTSFSFLYGNNQRDRNPDDQSTMTASSGKDLGVTFNTNGNYSVNKGWWKNINYVLSGSYTAKKSHYEQLYTAANAPYSMTTTDGAILSNTAGLNLYDEQGNKLTNFTSVDYNHYAVYLPSSYFGQYDIDGKEVNLYAKATTIFFKKVGNLRNRILFGSELKIDGNEGNGKTFSDTAPPYRNLSAMNASFRQRKYKDIPYLRQLGVYLEENATYTFGKRELNVQAGLRYDKISDIKDALSYRFNASFEAVPNILTLKGGYGIAAKAPTQLYLYPEDAYFEYVNINEMSTSVANPVYMTTTKVYSAANKDLEVAVNKKSEVGFELKLGQAKLEVTGFLEKLDNGYGMGEVAKPVTYNQYVRSSTNPSAFNLSQSNSVLAVYYSPKNNRSVHTKGMEFDLNLGRIDPIRTSFDLSGAWIVTESYNNDYTYFDDYSETDASKRTHIGLYEQGMSKYDQERMSTTLRATHNIPGIGFVVTLAAQAVWKDANWYKFGNDTIPVKYISKADGQVYDYDPAQKDVPEFKLLLRQRSDKSYIKESFPPLFSFNMNITKEIGDFVRVSFLANNMFRSYPLAKYKRSSSYYTRNERFYFGMELALKF